MDAQAFFFFFFLLVWLQLFDAIKDIIFVHVSVMSTTHPSPKPDDLSPNRLVATQHEQRHMI